MDTAIPCGPEVKRVYREHVPAATVGQERAGAAHFFFEQKPYIQFVPVVQILPTVPPVLSPADLAVAL